MTSTRRRFIAITGTAAALAPVDPLHTLAPAPASARSRALAFALEAVRRFDDASAALDLAIARAGQPGDDAAMWRADRELSEAGHEYGRATAALMAAFPLLSDSGCGLIANGRLYLADPEGLDRCVYVVPLARVADLSRG